MASKIVAYNGEKYAISYEIIAPTSSADNSNLNAPEKTEKFTLADSEQITRSAGFRGGEPRAQRAALPTCEILFLHGWGANKELMQKAFAPHFKDLRQIYLDLPGFGGSEVSAPLATEDYAAITKEFLRAAGLNPSVIVGHSFGGKVALLLNPPLLALLSSAGILCQKPLAVRAKIAVFKTLKKLGFGGLYGLFATKDVAGMSRVMYETLKNVVDEDFAPKFAAFGARALVFWGEKDTATPLSSGEKIASLIKNSEFFPLEGDHFFFLSHGERVAKVIKNELSNLKTAEFLGDEPRSLEADLPSREVENNCDDLDEGASFCPCCGGER